MPNLLTKVLVFVVANLGWGWLHIQAFQSPYPLLAFFSLCLHLIALLRFPYSKVFTIKSK